MHAIWHANSLECRSQFSPDSMDHVVLLTGWYSVVRGARLMPNRREASHLAALPVPPPLFYPSAIETLISLPALMTGSFLTFLVFRTFSSCLSLPSFWSWPLKAKTYPQLVRFLLEN